MASVASGKQPIGTAGKMRDVAKHRAAEVVDLVQKLEGNPDAHVDLVAKLHYWMGSDMRSGERAAEGMLQPESAQAAPTTSALAFAAREALNPENFTVADAAAFLWCSQKLVNDQRQQGKVYAMLPAGKEHGFQYPRWQFDADPARLAAVLAPFVKAQVSCWVIHGFFMTESASIDSRTPRDCVLDAEFPLERVVALADSRLGYTRAKPV